MNSEKCPSCGTFGKNWENEENVFHCPSCLTIYSEFGLVLEAQKRAPDFWS